MLFLRDATSDDLELLLTWANDPCTRQNSFHTEMISYEEHERWFGRMMKDPDQIQYILMEDDTPVGQIRIRKEQGKGEISYSVAPEARGKGYGKKLLQLAEEKILAEHPEIEALTAAVKAENSVSSHLFLQEAYEVQYTMFEKKIRS